METHLIHQRETTEDTESFLQENIDKFQTDAVFLLKQMIKGEKLTAKTVVQKYGKEPRRLRDLEISGKCQKRWVLKENGKRSYVEYYVEVPRQLTKSEVIANAHKAMQSLEKIESNLTTALQQGNLFQ